MAAEIKAPRNEILWVTFHNTKGDPRFIITSTPFRDMHFLYEIIDGKPKRIAKDPSPGKLIEEHEVYESL